MINLFFHIILVTLVTTLTLQATPPSNPTFSIEHLNLKQKIAQLFFVGTNQNNTNTYKNQWIKQHNIGGVFLLGNQFQDAKDVKQFCDNLNKNQAIPILIAVDQEGGRVARIKKGIPHLKPAHHYGQTKSALHCYQKGEELGHALKELGIDICLGPVLDRDHNDSKKIIGDRSYNQHPYIAAKCGVAFAIGLQNSDILACAKHFPNHGSSSQDSHKGLPIINETKDDITVNNIPYKYAIKSNIPFIMVGHLQYPQIDAKHPASLSKTIMTTLLKNQLNYKGIVITDDLNMNAITDTYTLKKACLLALTAGADALLVEASPKKIQQCILYIYQQVKKGNIREKDIDFKVKKILKLKKINAHKK